ncbi:MAG: OprO/OprP family phosphate-selective porin [Prevotella sp.]|nr:OprO/OprP family phosphate-selective porin [Prevotella sp.]
MTANTLKAALLTLLLTITCGTIAPAQTGGDEPDWTKELTSRITLNGYAQAGWSYQDRNGVQTNSYNLKRTLLWAKARITDRWSFLFMHDFNSEVQEFYADFRLTRDDAIHVRLGQFKNSFSMENPLSPVQLELIDVCSMAVTQLSGCYDPLHGLNYGRDQGLLVYGNLLDNLLHYELALMSGQGINKKDGNNDKDFIGKLELRPVGGLRVVGSVYLGKGNAVDTAEWNPEITVGDNYTRNRYSVGAELKTGRYASGRYKGPRPMSLRAEWLGGKDGNVGSRGGYVTTTLPVVDALDVVASAETFDKNTGTSGWQQTNLTAGLQYWFYKNCRLQLQYTRCLCGENISQKDYNWLQAQVQVAF